MIMDYCEKVVALTGIRLFAIDREVNSEELAGAFEDRKWGLICMLDANQYEGLSDWDAEFIGRLEDGSKVWSGPWKEPRNDNRHFVIVEKEDPPSAVLGNALREGDGEGLSTGRKSIAGAPRFRRTASRE